jgi:hypothetical protein
MHFQLSNISPNGASSCGKILYKMVIYKIKTSSALHTGIFCYSRRAQEAAQASRSLAQLLTLASQELPRLQWQFMPIITCAL